MYKVISHNKITICKIIPPGVKMCGTNCGSIYNRCRGRNFCSKFMLLLDKMEITPYQKETIKSRFVTEVYEIEFDYARSVLLFIGLTNLVTIAGILITSFTTLTKAVTVSEYWQDVLTWMTWALSLTLTLANGWLTTFGIYKKYVLNDVTLEKMYNEGWSFIAGVNRYEKLSMDERVVTFCSKVEQIITKTTIKQLSDNTAGVDVHDVLEVSPENQNVPADNVPSNNVPSNNVPADTVISIGPQDNIAQPKRKKKMRKNINYQKLKPDQ
jgi:predicted nucleic acid-binding Zn ribbon protein